MERNSGNGTVLKGADEQADDTGLLTEEQGQSGELTPLYEKVEQVLINDRPTDALLADLSPETTNALFQQAHAATAAQLIDARSNISLAFQNAPEALAKTGNYAGVMPGPEAFTTVYGAYDGGQQFARFDQKVKVGKQVFDMRAMSNQEIQAQLLDAAVSAGHSQEGQSRYQTTAAAAQQVLEARSNDPAGQVGGAFPEVNAAWRAVFDQGGYAPAAVQKALALTVAAQQHLGIKNVQPIPQPVLENLRGLSEQDIKAKTDDLLAGTTDPNVKLAMSRQFAGAGLLERPPQALGADRFGRDDGRFGQDNGFDHEQTYSYDGLTEKSDSVAQLTPDERIGQSSQDDLPIDVLLADLSPGVFGKLAQTRPGPNVENLINAGANVDRASQDARAAFSDRATYSGPRPGPEQFAAVFGAEEGGKQFKTFKLRANVSPYLASMRLMPASDIDAMLNVAMPARNPFSPKKARARYKQEQARYDREMAQYEQKKPRYDLIANAAALILQERQVDPAAYVRQVLPSVDAAWKQVGKPEDYGAAVAQSFAAQRQLGIKNIQPLPLSVAKDLIKTWSDSNLKPDAEEAERKVLEAVPDPKQRAAVAKQLANVRAAQTETPAGASDGEPDTNDAGAGEPVQPATRQFAKTIDLSPADILRLKKTLMTEWFVRDGDDEAKGIIDTVLNRLASEHWGSDVSQVVNSWAQFSDVNSVRTLPHGRNNVDQLSVNDPRFAKSSKMVDEYLAQRAAGAPSVVGDNLNYANPKVSDATNLVWIYKLDGPKLGQHWHGTVDELRKFRPGEFGINLPKDYYPSEP